MQINLLRDNKNLQNIAADLKSWYVNALLPLWGNVGIDRVYGGFFEQLNMHAEPIELGYKRTRVTARQIYVFSHATELGLEHYRPLADQGMAFLLNHHKGEQSGSWVRRVTRQGKCADATHDLYDYAFVLFALAWYTRISNEQKYINLARQTLIFIQENFRLPLGGYAHEIGASAPFQQNPHMHLVEAMLILYEVSRDPIFLNEAAYIINIFLSSFLNPETYNLREYFNYDWSFYQRHMGDYVEPGHMLEWSWILWQYSCLEHVDLTPIIEKLHVNAINNGRSPHHGFYYDIVSDHGGIIKADMRLWPQLEAIKSEVACHNLKIKLNVEDLPSHLKNLKKYYFEHPQAGLWNEHLNEKHQSILSYCPASSLYHISLALNELFNLVSARTSLLQDA